MSNINILIVEDESIVALDLKQTLISMGFSITDIITTGEEAIKKVGETCPDLVLMDIMLNGEMDGTEAAHYIRDHFDIPVIYLTAYADHDTLQRAKITEPYGYIIKPFNERDLFVTIDMVLYKHSMEREIKKSQKWFSTTLSSIGDAVITTDNYGSVTFMNSVAEKLMGWKLEEILNKKLTEVFNIINMSSRKPAENTVSKVLLEGRTVGLANNTLLITRDEIEIPIDDSAAPIKDDKGNIIGVVFVFRDITERYQAEEALRKMNEELELRVRERTSELETLNRALQESEEHYRQIVETATEGIWMMDRTCRTTFVNKKMADMLACTVQEMNGKSMFDFLDDEWSSDAERIATCCQGISKQQEIKFLRKDGEDLWAILSANPFFASNEQNSGSLVMVTNITKRKQLEKEMVRLDRLNLIGQMSAGISHEVRNPMTTVRGFLQLLSKKESYIDDKEFFNIMISELDRANGILSEFLSLAQIKAANLKECNLNDILSTMYPLLLAQAVNMDKNILMEQGDIHDLVLDEKDIRQLVLNLVRNGLEAIKPGGIVTLLTCINDNRVCLLVKDNGPGISPKILDNLGTPFLTTKENGTGLGLSVCFSIAQRHNATIEVESSPGGTTFNVKF